MTNSQTLAERMSASRLPAAEALRVAVSLAERLRELHEKGCCHGALTPSAVLIDGGSVELLPAADAGITPYTAPEVVRGRPAGDRSDLFSFGAIVYEMFTGRLAFQADDPQMLCAILMNVEPRPSGSVVVDRLVAGCVAKSPEGRFPDVPRLQLELRMLASAARRGAPLDAPASVVVPKVLAAAAGSAESRPSFAPAVAARSEMQALESRMASRMEEQEKSIASVERIAGEVLKALREGAAPAQGRQPERRYGDYDDPTMARLDRAFALLSEKVSRIDLMVCTALERLEKLEGSLDSWDADAARLRETVTRDIRGFERAVKSQSAALESARTAMGQTDDLVERVVEALDSLQSMFVSSGEERKAG